MKRYPCSSNCPISPVLNHPSSPLTVKKLSSLAPPLFSYPPKHGGPLTMILPWLKRRGDERKERRKKERRK